MWVCNREGAHKPGPINSFKISDSPNGRLETKSVVLYYKHVDIRKFDGVNDALMAVSLSILSTLRIQGQAFNAKALASYPDPLDGIRASNLPRLEYTWLH